jgi:hypothetical protein
LGHGSTDYVLRHLFEFRKDFCRDLVRRVATHLAVFFDFNQDVIVGPTDDPKGPGRSGFLNGTLVEAAPEHPFRIKDCCRWTTWSTFYGKCPDLPFTMLISYNRWNSIPVTVGN